MWFVFTLVTILFWSGSDLFSKMGSAPDDKNSHWKMVLAVGAGRENPSGRTGLLIACGMVALALVILLFTGGLMKMTSYDAGAADSSTPWEVSNTADLV